VIRESQQAEIVPTEPKILEEPVPEPIIFPATPQEEASSSKKVYKEELVEIWKQKKNEDGQRDPFEVEKDISYLLSWLRNLSAFEVDCALKLEQKENPERSEVLEAYLNMIYNTDYSGHDEEIPSSPMEVEEEVTPQQQQTPVIFNRLPVTRRKSDDSNDL
jgi:hypothetical protein